MDEFVTYQFMLPCTISLYGRPKDEDELRVRMAAALVAQLQEQDTADVGSIIEQIAENGDDGWQETLTYADPKDTR